MKPIRVSSVAWFAMLILGVCLLGLRVQPVQAAVVDEDGNVGAKEVIQDDLIIGGQNVIIDGTVNGAVLASAERIVVNGTINGDLFMFGTDVILSEGANVTGNLFGAARYMEVRGRVGGKPVRRQHCPANWQQRKDWAECVLWRLQSGKPGWLNREHRCVYGGISGASQWRN